MPTDAFEDFLLVRDDALSGDLCDEFIRRFAEHPGCSPGRAGAGVNPAIKDSLDLDLSHLPEFADLMPQLMQAVFAALVAYLRRYPYALLASSSIARMDRNSGVSSPLTAEDLTALSERDLGSLINQFFRCGEMVLQKYQRGRGGYFAWHTEVSPADATAEKLHRILPWMVYLDDVVEGGETEWLYQSRLVTPRRGRLAMWPAYFTHTHRGNVPRSSDKHVITSWILFQRAGRPV